jgi:hypothetical protein
MSIADHGQNARTAGTDASFTTSQCSIQFESITIDSCAHPECFLRQETDLMGSIANERKGW